MGRRALGLVRRRELLFVGGRVFLVLLRRAGLARQLILNSRLVLNATYSDKGTKSHEPHGVCTLATLATNRVILSAFVEYGRLCRVGLLVSLRFDLVKLAKVDPWGALGV